jgi:hypothetical protein
VADKTQIIYLAKRTVGMNNHDLERPIPFFIDKGIQNDVRHALLSLGDYDYEVARMTDSDAPFQAKTDRTKPFDHVHAPIAGLKTSCRLSMRIRAVLRQVATRSRSARFTRTCCWMEPN